MRTILLLALIACGSKATISHPLVGVSQSSITTAWGSRRTIVYAPSNPEGLPLLVALHGCTQTAEEFLAATRLSSWAERERFVLLAVEQSVFANPSRCWNWFLPVNQTGLTGEPSIIVAAIERTRRDLALGDDTFVLGLSAGGAMAGILSVCRPDLIDAALLHSAPKVPVLQACGGVSERQVMLLQGTADPVVPSFAADLWWQHYYSMLDDADDGSFNQSVATTLATQTTNQRDVTVRRAATLEHWSIEGLGHAWSGGDDRYDYADALGPDATALGWAFFSRQASIH